MCSLLVKGHKRYTSQLRGPLFSLLGHGDCSIFKICHLVSRGSYASFFLSNIFNFKNLSLCPFQKTRCFLKVIWTFSKGVEDIPCFIHSRSFWKFKHRLHTLLKRMMQYAGKKKIYIATLKGKVIQTQDDWAASLICKNRFPYIRVP